MVLHLEQKWFNKRKEDIEVYKKQKIREIRENLNMLPNIEWDTNAITPGTKFMEKLSKYLHNIDFKNEYNHDCQVIISDSNEPGEGEHKILQYLKQNYSNNDKRNNSENQYLIYGLDADLIMLSMASKINNIYLLRESVHFGKIQKDSLLLLNIDKLSSFYMIQ